MAAEQTSVEQLELRLEEQAAAVSELTAQLTNERSAAEKRGHDLVEMMGRLMDKVSDIDSRMQGGVQWAAATAHCWWCSRGS